MCYFLGWEKIQFHSHPHAQYQFVCHSICEPNHYGSLQLNFHLSTSRAIDKHRFLSTDDDDNVIKAAKIPAAKRKWRENFPTMKVKRQQFFYQ
jgi:hypothetical protein